MSAKRSIGLPAAVLPILLLLGCPPASDPAPAPTPPPPGVAVRFEGVDVESSLVEAFVPFLRGLRPGQAVDSIRRFILLHHAIPLAWGRARRPNEFVQARRQAETWSTSIQEGQITLEELARRRAIEEGGSPEEATALTLGWSSLPLPLARAAFEATPGQIIGPIESALGWHLLRVERLETAMILAESLVTVLQVVSVPEGSVHLEEIRELRGRLAREQGSVEVLDPDYRAVVPIYLRNDPREEGAPRRGESER